MSFSNNLDVTAYTTSITAHEINTRTLTASFLGNAKNIIAVISDEDVTSYQSARMV